ncbi:MAG: cyclic peptide export ABC transporter [Firmicutes bacterium]|nr:cyclic peptide export ABC transporter [Bacillota bacterium]
MAVLKRIRFLRWASLLLVIFGIFSSGVWASPGQIPATGLSQAELKRIDSYIEKQMEAGKIPGLALVIVRGARTIFQKGYGFADLESKKPVTSATLFELGSTSKAFTGLGILQLKAQGKLSLNDPVAKHLPWFWMKYRGKKAQITLGNLLYQTSGIPFKTIGAIPVADGPDALEKTVRTLIGKELDHAPGEAFLYATINYDVLGLIIEKVSGQSYEAYIRENLFRPMGFGATYLERSETQAAEFASGYKLAFLRPMKYQAPAYRGNVPAGYIMTNARDLARWLQIQMGLVPDLPPFYRSLINESHVPDRSVPPGPGGSSYAAGWNVFQSGLGEISHGGSNPNYSSFIIFRPGEKLGVGVLANLDSSYTQAAAEGVLRILQGKKPAEPNEDFYQGVDRFASAAILALAPVSLATLWLLLVLLWECLQRKRTYRGIRLADFFKIIISLLFMGIFGYCLYSIPDALYGGLPWNFVTVWAPATFLWALLLIFGSAALFYLHFMLSFLFPKQDERPYFSMILLSAASGLGNAIVIFVVNEVLNRGQTGSLQGGLLLYFIMGLVLYVYGQRLVRLRLVSITNELVYQKRAELIRKILKASYHKFEAVEDGKFHAGLNNDTEIVSNFVNTLITGATSLITLICCFIYLGALNLYGLLLSALVILIAAGIFFGISSSANKLMEQTRDIQNKFFKFINDLTRGFKDLSLHGHKRDEFGADMLATCGEYRQKRIRTDLKFANVFIFGELLFTFVIGVVAFIFPLIFPEIQNNSLRSYIFVFLYMTGPVHGVLGTLPQMFQIRVSWKRINDLSAELALAEQEQKAAWPAVPGPFTLQLSQVEYQYQSNTGETFKVGPLDATLRSGELIFITGGNGSGKSTLAKLITGLYPPGRGEIILNGMKLGPGELGEYYSAVFSDFYLFEKLYGIDYQARKHDLEQYLKALRIDDKVAVRDGAFSTIQLSSGQRKRLALLVSYLEDYPIYLFDEWAADQDPEFRKHFYQTLLPELKARGKLVIAITHDDRYFYLADRVIKMELGQIVEIKDRSMNQETA